MIHSFSVKNFYSFHELVTVNFTVDKNAPQNESYFVTSSGTRVSQIQTVVGSNASGKTNLLKVLPFIKWLISDSFDRDPNIPIPVHPFHFSNGENEPTDLFVTFEVNQKIYDYIFSLNSERILSEELRVKSAKRKKSRRLFVRKYSQKTKTYLFESNISDLPRGFANLIRSNSSIVGLASRLNHKESKEIFNYWQLFKTNVSEIGWSGDVNRKDSRIYSALNFLSENKYYKKNVENFLAKFDLGLSEIEIKKDKDQDITAKIAHTIGKKQSFLDFRYESSGTKQIIILLITILQVLKSGGIAVLDEFDVNLHPDIISYLIDLFLNYKTNPNHAQILFSTSCHLVLNRLDKYQIILTEKNQLGKSESWRLDDVSGVRSDDNYFAKYLAGAYGATPQIK